MIFIVDLQNENKIDKYEVDGFIINSSLYSCFNGKTFTLHEINELSKLVKNKGKKVYINVDRIIHENDILSLKEFINLLEYYDYLIFSDIAFLNFGIEYSKLIYSPNTLVASSYEKSIFDELGIQSFLANELSNEEYNRISNKTDLNVTVYGYHQIMYSYRPLLSLYEEFSNCELTLKNKILYLKEELREEKYLIYESIYGTFIYTPYIYVFFKELYGLQEKLNIVRFNCFNIDEDKMIEVIKLYRLLINGDDIDKLYQKLVNIDSNINNGFLKQSSVLLKGVKNE